MNHLLSLLLVLALIPGGILIGFWTAGLIRLRRELRSTQSLEQGLRAADANPPAERVCVIVPAHNEAGVIAALIQTLRAQTYPHLSVVLALDRCTDATAATARAAIAGDPRFGIFEIDHCPEDWAGKVHAIWSTVTTHTLASGADLLLFVDADAQLHPEVVRASVGMLRLRSLDYLSLWSRMIVRNWFDAIVQPQCAMELAYNYPLDRVNSAERRRPFANGQFILFRREPYFRIGGHQAVNEAVLEDMALARLAAEHGLKAGIYLGEEMLRVRMYDDWGRFREGWKRLFIDCAKRKVRRLRRAMWRMSMLYAFCPLASLAALVIGPMDVHSLPPWAILPILGVNAVALVLWLFMMFVIYRLGKFPLWAAPLAPLGALIASRLVARAARDLARGKPMQWGGRPYVLEAR